MPEMLSRCQKGYQTSARSAIKLPELLSQCQMLIMKITFNVILVFLPARFTGSYSLLAYTLCSFARETETDNMLKLEGGINSWQKAETRERGNAWGYLFYGGEMGALSTKLALASCCGVLSEN